MFKTLVKIILSLSVITVMLLFSACGNRETISLGEENDKEINRRHADDDRSNPKNPL